jgi:nucleotide-binding universal stress UspA family protein
MSYKTILIYLNDSRRAEALLEAGLAVARRSQAHVIGLRVCPGVPLAPAIAAPYSEILGAAREAEAAETERLAQLFAKATSKGVASSEWRFVEAPHIDVAPFVIEQARCVDLVIASQQDPDWERASVLDFPERLVIDSGRPVLLVPYVGRYPKVGTNIIVAWKETREAARAAFDALPLLVNAEKTQLLTVTERDLGAAPALIGTIASGLGRHGLRPIVRNLAAGDLDVGDQILDRLADDGADLLVMGGYGHWRMRELLFGGVTRHILQHMTVPTLMSH